MPNLTNDYLGPRKVMIAGDTHGNLEHLQYLFDTAHDNYCDVIFVVGDFGYWAHTPEGVRFLDRVADIIYDYDIPLYFLAGNHDNMRHLLERHAPTVKINEDPVTNLYDNFIAIRENLFFAPHGLAWTWWETSFVSLGGAYSVDKAWRLDQEKRTNKPGFLWFPDEEMTDDHLDSILNHLDVTNKYADVILAHDKPIKAHIEGWQNKPDIIETHFNQRRMQKALDDLMPKYYVHGHLHWPYRNQLEHRKFTGTYYTTVVGLDSGPEGHSPREQKVYTPKDSWVILDTAERSLRN